MELPYKNVGQSNTVASSDKRVNRSLRSWAILDEMKGLTSDAVPPQGCSPIFLSAIAARIVKRPWTFSEKAHTVDAERRAKYHPARTAVKASTIMGSPMASPKHRLVPSAAKSELELSVEFEDSPTQAALSTALISVFRGKFCDAVLPNRKTTSFKKDAIIYDVGDRERTFYFLQDGFVRVGTITSDGHELIYDVRKGGDVIGELCASEPRRPDRAVALEQTQTIAVPFQDVMEVVRKQPDLLARLVDVFCRALNEAYAQVNTLAVDDTVHRLSKVLLKLAAKIGQTSGTEVVIPTYLTQEEIAQMVAVRRERISTALNFLRRKRMIGYTDHGHLLLNVKSLESYSTS
jgi:CRP/FNR family cyclic AMP-dependent transcriptional regulator